MLLFWRKFLFYILLAAYLVITPYAILYALGYTVHPTQDEIFNKTGLLSIESEPRGARVYVEGKKFSRKTPSAVRDLLPGDYQVEIFKKGFDRWSKKISIYPEKATRLEPIILLPQHPEEEEVSPRSYEFLLPLMIDFRIFGLSTRDLESLKGTDIFLKRTFDVGEKASLEQRYEVKDFYTKGNSSLVLFDVLKNGNKSREVLRLNREKEARNLDSVMPDDVDFFDWDAKSSEFIYFLKEGILSAIDWEKQKVIPALAAEVLGFGVKSGRLYVLKKDWTLWTSPAKAENLKWELVEDFDVPRPPKNVKWVKIEVFKREFFQKDVMLLLSDEGLLLSSREPFMLAESGVRGFQYAVHADEEKVLFWTRKEIFAAAFSKESEGGEKNLPEIVNLYDKGSDIQQAFWSYEASHVLFRDDDRVFLAEAHAPEPYFVRPVMQVAGGAPIFYHDLTHFIYYLQPGTRHLMRRKLAES